MDTKIKNEMSQDQIDLLREKFKLENQLKGGAAWFYWIAGLSIINTITTRAGVKFTFILGLGITQLLDGFAKGIEKQTGMGAGSTPSVVVFVINILIAGLFILIGYFAIRANKPAHVIGMVLYFLDGVIFLLVGDWLDVGFHLFALLGLYGGLRAMNLLKAVEEGKVSLQSLRPTPRKQVRDKQYWLRLVRLAAIILVAALCPILVMMLLMFRYY